MKLGNALNIFLKNRKKPKIEPMIDDKCGFLYLDKNNMPMVALHWEKYFQHIREKYNKIYKKELPVITPHVARHTFCSNMAKSGVSPKSLQYLMGHSDIGVTLNTYTHLQFEDLDKEMEKVCEGWHGLRNLNLDQFIDQTIDNLCRVIPNYTEIRKIVSATSKT